MEIIAPPSSTTPIVESPSRPPTPAPSAPPSPPRKPPIAPPATDTPPKPESDLMSDAYGDLDKYTTKAEKTVEKPKPDEASIDPETTEEPQKPVEGKPVNKSSIADLRKQYDNTKKENYQLREELKRIKETKPQEDPQLKVFKERYEAAEKRREELETEIKYSAYERSPEYLEKYQKPYMDAYEWGKQSVSKLKITLDDGSIRQATPEDFDEILIPDDGKAIDLAEQMFGNKAKIALDHRWELKKLDAARYRAIEDFKKQGGEREIKFKETESKRNEQMGQQWKQLNGEVAERFPKWFKPEEGDADGNKILEEGYALADSAFSNSNGMQPDALVRLHASIRNRAAAFAREVYRNNKLEGRVAELEKELEQYKSSSPGSGDGKSSSVANENWEDQLVADA